MKVNELRIGNKIGAIRAENIVIVTDIYRPNDEYLICTDNFAERGIEDFEPIPITEEWLLKLGFDRNKSTMDLMGSYSVYLERYDNSLYLMTINFDYEYINKVEYVHQLQNIYFAITGNELIIN